MRSVIQRVANASVSVNGQVYSSIGKGLLVLLAVEETDDTPDIEWLAQKVINLRIFPDHNALMNYAIGQINGELLVVSQFTLYASTKKGNRPSYLRSAQPKFAQETYLHFLNYLSQISPVKVKSGVFGANMQVDLCNDGPVTIIMDTKIKE